MINIKWYVTFIPYILFDAFITLFKFALVKFPQDTYGQFVIVSDETKWWNKKL